MYNWLRKSFFSRVFRYLTALVWFTGGKEKVIPQYSESRVKHMIDDPETVVFDSLLGIVRVKPSLRLTSSQNSFIITSTDQSQLKNKYVSLVSGGPSGNEPLEALFVGKRLLSAAVCGSRVFSPPDVMSIYKAIKMVTGKAGCVLIVRNHPLNVLNFSLAAQWARRDGLKVEKLIVSDDAYSEGPSEIVEEEKKNSLSPPSSPKDTILKHVHSSHALNEEFEQKNINTKNRKKGLTGTAFIIKILGSACHKGKNLREMISLGRLVHHNISTMGFSFDSCVVPGNNEPNAYIDKDEMEVGIGISGENGERVRVLSCKDIVALLLDNIIPCIPQRRDGSPVAVLVNNLGGLSVMEMYIFASRVIEVLEIMWKIEVRRIYVGTFSSCLYTRGGSISVMMFPEGKTKEFLEYLDDNTTCSDIWPSNFSRKAKTMNRCSAGFTLRRFEGELPGMGRKKSGMVRDGINNNDDEESEGEEEEEEEDKLGFLRSEKSLKEVLGIIITTLRNSEDELNDLDGPIGDGDCGTSLRRGMDLIEEANLNFKDSSPANILGEVGMRLYWLGGTTGTIYCSFVTALAESYRRNITNISEKKNLVLGRMLKDGCQAVMDIGGARRGDCTFLDAIVPVYEILDEKMGDATIKDMADAAREGYLATKDLEAKVGKASMLKEKSIGFPDPAAKAVYNIFRDLELYL